VLILRLVTFLTAASTVLVNLPSILSLVVVERMHLDDVCGSLGVEAPMYVGQ
jgi:hypothetical protein